MRMANCSGTGRARPPLAAIEADVARHVAALEALDQGGAERVHGGQRETRNVFRLSAFRRSVTTSPVAAERAGRLAVEREVDDAGISDGQAHLAADLQVLPLARVHRAGVDDLPVAPDRHPAPPAGRERDVELPCDGRGARGFVLLGRLCRASRLVSDWSAGRRGGGASAPAVAAPAAAGEPVADSPAAPLDAGAGATGVVSTGDGVGDDGSACASAREVAGGTDERHRPRRPPNPKYTMTRTSGRLHPTTRHSRLARRLLVDDDLLGVGDEGRWRLLDRRVGETGHEAPDRLLGVEADFLRVGAHEGPQEDPAGQARDVVSFERLERRHRDLGAVGDRPQGDARHARARPAARRRHRKSRLQAWIVKRRGGRAVAAGEDVGRSYLIAVATRTPKGAPTARPPR